MNKAKLCIAVLGCGTIARSRHLPELLESPNVGEIILGDVAQSNVNDLIEKYRVKRFYTGVDSWKEILNIPDIDGVIICTPNEFHGPIAIHAMKKGKHVLVEKPMAVCEDEAQTMSDIAYSTGKLLLVGHHRRHQNCYVIGKRIVQSGLLGKVRGYLAQHKQPGPIEWAPNSKWFYDETKKGTGVMMDLGIHMADTISWYLDSEYVQEVHSIITQKNTLFEQARCILQYQSGIGGVIDVAWGVFEPEKRVTVYCENGKLIVDEYSKEGVQVFLNNPRNTKANIQVPEHHLNAEGFPKFGVVDHFVNCIIGGELERQRLKEHLTGLSIVSKALEIKIKKGK